MVIQGDFYFPYLCSRSDFFCSLSLKKLEKAEEIPAPETTRRVPDFTETRNGSTIFSRL